MVEYIEYNVGSSIKQIKRLSDGSIFTENTKYFDYMLNMHVYITFDMNNIYWSTRKNSEPIGITNISNLENETNY